MKTRSWLAGARCLEDLGNHFYAPTHYSQWDDARDTRAERNFRKRLDAPAPGLCDSPRFFCSSMHDAWVVKVDRSPAAFVVCLDCEDAMFFSRELSSLLDIEPAQSIWPVELLLIKPIYVRCARYDRLRALRYADWRQLGLSPSGYHDQLRYDWFFEQDGRIQWIADIASRLQSPNGLSNDLFLMIDCHRAMARDGRRRAIENAYGEAAGQLWEAALVAPEYPLGGGTLVPFLKEAMKARGITPDSIRSQAESKISAMHDR